MLGLRLIPASFVALSLLVACSGTNPVSPASDGPGTSLVVQSKLPKFLRIERTPARPPKPRHRITAAMRARAKAAGWQQLTGIPTFTEGPQSALLLTDGSIMVEDYCTPNWYRLTPSSTGSYTNGTWSATAPMPKLYGPLYFASAVLPDGKLIVNGGEYNFCGPAESSDGAIYDPVANTWTSVTPPYGWTEIGDAQSVVLANGTYMLGNCCSAVQALYDEASSTWTEVGSGKYDANSEEGWTLLRNGNLIVADVTEAPAYEYYNAVASDWSHPTKEIPVNLTAAEEIGPQCMMPNNVMLVVGADGYTAIYNGNNGTWKQGPNMPVVGSQQLDVADGPCTVQTDGQIMIAASPGIYSTPAQFVLYTGKKFELLTNPPNAANDSSYNIRLLLLPTGQIFEDDGSNDIEIYTPKNAPPMGLAPEITSVPSSLTEGSTYTIKGKRFNGYTQDNFYGDDDQQATNYPLVRITSGSGNVVYARTHDFSYMGIGSDKAVSTEFDVPTGIASGKSTLQVVTNGVASKSVSVTIGSK